MATARNILLVDPDPATTRALGPALRRRGYKVHAARDASRGLQLAILRFPDLILLDERAPLVDPRTFVRILRANPRTEHIPVVLLGSGPRSPSECRPGLEANRSADPRRVRGSRRLTKPLSEEEVLACVEQVLRSVDAARAASAPGAELQGDLARIAVPDLLQILALNRKTGRLEVEREGMHASVTFLGGRVVDAAAGPATGEKALYRIVALREGRFAFVPGEPTAPARIQRRLEELVMEGARRSDEAARLAPTLPAAGERVLLAARPQEVPPALRPAMTEVVALLAAPRTLQEVLDGASSSDLEILRAIAALLEGGYARREPRAAGEAPLLAPEELNALRSRLARDRPAASPPVGKVLVAGGGPLARRALLARLAALARFTTVDGGEPVELGTLGRLDLGDGVQVDVVALPGDPALVPVWRPLAAGALGMLLLLPVDGLEEELARLSARCRFPAGACVSSQAEIPPALWGIPRGCLLLGPDPGKALSSLLAAASAARPGCREEP